jgi:hypothetical protein
VAEDSLSRIPSSPGIKLRQATEISLGKKPPVTLLDALRERSSEANLRRATDALMAAMPVGRALEITPAVIAAAAAGDVAQLLTLFAEEVEPEPEDFAALAELDREPPDRQTLSAEEARRELGLPAR